MDESKLIEQNKIDEAETTAFDLTHPKPITNSKCDDDVSNCEMMVKWCRVGTNHNITSIQHGFVLKLN